MYLHAILGYLSWPALILATYYLVRLALNVFEKTVENPAEE